MVFKPGFSFYFDALLLLKCQIHAFNKKCSAFRHPFYAYDPFFNISFLNQVLETLALIEI